VEPTLAVEHVGEREKIELIRAAAVMEHEQPSRFAGWRAFPMLERGHRRGRLP
jgi:hypothetical protein